MCNQNNKSVELADVFRMHRESYCKNNTLTPEQHKAINAICNCRTSVLGGHIEQCDNCGSTQVSYNSCRNRHCPKCQSLKTAKWLEDRQKELLPVSYFHAVFTLPHELNTLVLYNKKELYSCLMRAVWETIKTLGQDPKRLNGLMGMLAILHTWGQNLLSHNHVHCIVSAGALVNGNQWRESKSNYLFPIKMMSQIFRGFFISTLRTLYKNNQLKIPHDPNPKTNLNISENFDLLLNSLMEKPWVVYVKEPFAAVLGEKLSLSYQGIRDNLYKIFRKDLAYKTRKQKGFVQFSPRISEPFAGPKKLLDYLGRYVNKIAISNCRIVSCDAKSVKFKWRDYADGNKIKTMELKPEEFIRRFLSHVIPKGFMRVRFFGFLANACKNKNVTTIRKLFSYAPTEEKQKKDIRILMLELTGNDITLCPKCKKGHFYTIQMMPNKLTKISPDTS